MESQLSISQNFIIDPELITKIIARSDLISEDTVIDIGAGKGSLTFPLAKQCHKVIAYELDPNLARSLGIKIGSLGLTNITLHEKDFLSEEEFPDHFKVFSNIPFSRSADIIRKLLLSGPFPTSCYLFLEKGAAYRFMGINGESLLSLNIGLRYESGFTWQFKKNDFKPVPDADIVLVNFIKRPIPLLSEEKIPEFLTFLEFVLLKKKHDLKGALLSIFTFKQLQRIRREMGIDIKQVPSSLKIEQWLELYSKANLLISDLSQKIIKPL